MNERNGMGEWLEKVLKAFLSVPKMDKMGFLSSFFKTTEADYTDAEFIDLDIVRSGEQVAPVLRNLSTGAVAIADDVFTGKQIKPPVYSLCRPTNIYDLLKRQPGETEYASVGEWYGRLAAKLKLSFVRMYEMIKRAVELQASQILQTGQLTIQDENGSDCYALDFKPKATHIKTVTNMWDAANADPLADLNALADAIRDDGLVDATNIIFGAKAWNEFIKNNMVQQCVKKDGLNLGFFNPKLANRGGKYMGYLESGAYRYDLWVYNARYQDFNGNTKNKFVDDKKVIMLADAEDLDFRLVYGGVPTLGMTEMFANIVPPVVRYPDSIELHNRVYHDVKADVYTAETKTRPICIPASIDRFGCLTVLA